MASGRRVGQRPYCHTFLCKFWHFQIAVSQWKLAWLTPNLGILWISVSSFRLCESIIANPIIYRLVPRPSRFETRQLKSMTSWVFCWQSRVIPRKIRRRSDNVLRWLIGTKHFHKYKTLPRIQKHFPESKTLPGIQNTWQNPKALPTRQNTSQNPKHLSK